MHILGITETCDLGSLYLRLIAEGHEVCVSVSEPQAQNTMAGMVTKVADWRSKLPWIREAGADGLILFEAVGFGALQDELRSEGLPVIGGSALGDKLESDRAFAQRLLSKFGLRVASPVQFASIDAGLEDIRGRPRRCVFKRSASIADTFVGMMDDGRDVASFLRNVTLVQGETFVLMDYIDGIETGVGAYFNGERFLKPACVDWEHKRFFAGDLGELTGEMGTVATFRGSGPLFEATLAPLEPMLRDAGHVGWVNLNTIINADGVWPLEFTCRFGYPGFAVLEPLQAVTWGELFGSILRREPATFASQGGYSLALVLSTPPFPYSRKELDVAVGLPVISDGIEPEHLHWGEVGKSGDEIVTAGLYGWTAVVTGTGGTLREAQIAAYERARRIRTPNLRYRLDIGDTLVSGDLQRLADWGWLAI